MTTTLKVLGQLKPAAATLTALYTVPGATTAIVSNLTVANESAIPTAFRISVAIAGAADDPEQYVAYDAAIGQNDGLNIGPLVLGAGDEIRVYATLATVAFSAFGMEMT